jgi:hypothetical protein
LTTAIKWIELEYIVIISNFLKIKLLKIVERLGEISINKRYSPLLAQILGSPGILAGRKRVKWNDQIERDNRNN